MPPPRKLSQQMDPISQYEDSVADHLSKILHCEDHQVIISSAKSVSSLPPSLLRRNNTKQMKAMRNSLNKIRKRRDEFCQMTKNK